MRKSGVFEVDTHGMRAVARKRGLLALVLELYQNAVDEKSQHIGLEIKPTQGRHYRISCTDDSPDGFRDLAESYVMYAPSYKRDDPEKRGQFNIGEKFVIAACEWAEIHSTTGIIRFDDNGRTRSRIKQDAGTTFVGELVSTASEVAEALDGLRCIIPPPGVELAVNYQLIAHRAPFAIATETLPTWLPGEDGTMRPTRRQTKVSLYEPLPGTPARIYEMGIPVVETGDRFDVDIAQRVLLNQERDNVTPGYLAQIRVIALNASIAADVLAPDDATATWVAQATADERVSDEAVRAVLDYRFGEKRVSYDPSEPEANKRAVEQGYNVIYGRTLSTAQWELARRAEAIRPAGQVTPSNKWRYSDDPEAEPERVIPESEWTPGMQRIVAHARHLAYELLGIHNLPVTIVNEAIRRPAAAAWMPEDRLIFNVGRLGYSWFERTAYRPDVNELLIHEFAHHYPGGDDHLSDKYHEALCDLGARMVNLALCDPDSFRLPSLMFA